MVLNFGRGVPMWTWCSKHEYRRERVESVGIFNYFRYLVFYADPNTNFLVLVLILVLLLHVCLFSFDILKNFSIKWLLMQNKLRKQLTWCKIWTLFKTFWPRNCATSLELKVIIYFLFIFIWEISYLFCSLFVCSKDCSTCMISSHKWRRKDNIYNFVCKTSLMSWGDVLGCISDNCRNGENLLTLWGSIYPAN